jgi:hypothetical protein
MRHAPLIALALAAAAAGCTDETGTMPTYTGTAALSCALPATCAAAEPSCVGLADNAGQSRFGLRITQLDMKTPALLRTGVIGEILRTDVLPAVPACRLDGEGSITWLLRFDTAKGTLELGGASPVSDPASGYAFLDQMMSGRRVAPASFAAKPDANGRVVVAEGRDLTLPLYLDASEVVLVPLRAARIAEAVLSPSQGCIGVYNAAGLRPEDGCLPDAAHPAFVSGGSFAGLIALEDADTVVLPSFAETLCAYLSGDPAKYGAQRADGVLACRREASAIAFRGDACTTSGSCGDAVAISADFAASSVVLHD